MRTNKFAAITTLLLVALILGATPAAFSQIVYGQPTSGGAQFIYSHWTLDDGSGVKTKLSQSYVPVTGFVPVKDNLEITFYAASTGNSFDTGGTKYSLNGMNDVRLQANQSFSNDHLLISAGVTLPTGKTELNLTDEYLVLQEISENYLNLPVRRLGEGFGFSLLFGGATVLGEGVRGGGSIMYEYVGKYTPYKDAGEYNPGDLLSFNAGMDLERGSWLWSIEGTYTTYTDDKFNDIKTFKQSPQFDFKLRSRSKSQSTTFNALLRYIARGDNKSYAADGRELDPFKLYGNEFSLGGSLGFKLGSKFSLVPNAQIRLIAENNITDDRSLGNASIVGFGSGIGWAVSKSLRLTGGGRYFTGSADGGNIDLSGYQLSIGLSAAM